MAGIPNGICPSMLPKIRITAVIALPSVLQLLNRDYQATSLISMKYHLKTYSLNPEWLITNPDTILPKRKEMAKLEWKSYSYPDELNCELSPIFVNDHRF